MYVNLKFVSITMELYETDISELKKFIVNEKIEGEFTEKYLILYNFATDCKYSERIQPELIKYLLPFYLKVIEQAVIYGNKQAIDIYYEFNSAIFFNKKNFKQAVGEKDYQYIMEYYIKQTIKCMEKENSEIIDWVSLFNTTVAFCNDNIRKLFKKIFEGSLKIKYSFFQYLSVFLFKESDNLLAVNESRAFWTSGIWNFDGGHVNNKFFWSDDVIEYFEKEITAERIEGIFNEVKPLICEILEPELVDFFSEEMHHNFVEGVFRNRKAEYLKKISCKSGEYVYWDVTF